MKKSLKVIALSLFGIILLGACGNNDQKSIAKTANSYLTVLYKNLEPSKAKEFATPESASFLEMIEQIQGMSGDIENARKESQGISFQLGEITIDGETAKVPFTMSKEGEESQEDVLQLRKVDGKWLVHQAKESPMPSGDDMDILEENIDEEIITDEEVITKEA